MLSQETSWTSNVQVNLVIDHVIPAVEIPQMI
jgi:hypothetical protein